MVQEHLGDQSSAFPIFHGNLSTFQVLITLTAFKEKLPSKTNHKELELVCAMSLAGELILLYFCCMNSTSFRHFSPRLLHIESLENSGAGV